LTGVKVPLAIESADELMIPLGRGGVEPAIPVPHRSAAKLRAQTDVIGRVEGLRVTAHPSLREFSRAKDFLNRLVLDTPLGGKALDRASCRGRKSICGNLSFR
jgi:hypothetical protein